tara:strand:+ start:1087 stop:1776 length:690 start_codon:yes stop_codon:yes gene_type:complete
MNVKQKEIVSLDNSFCIKNNNFIAFITKKNKNKSSDIILKETLMFKGFNFDNIASCNQIHSNRVQFIEKSGVYQETDGLICSLNSKLILLIQTADCIPIFIIDEINKLIGLVHSGWKGTRDSIVQSALSIFFNKGSKKENIKIYLGPSIKKCCYEINEDVSKYFNDKYLISKEQTLYLSLIDRIKDDILIEGIKSKNIFDSQICTMENQEYYSYRRNDNGRIYSVMGYK